MAHQLAGPGSGLEGDRVLLGMAVQGHASSQYLLGVMYGNGERMFRDPAQAVKWLGRAAAQGHGPARAHLAAMAERGDVSAHRTLGLLYRDGSGTRRDETMARRHLRAAARAGDPPALLALGTLGGADGTAAFHRAAEGAAAAVGRTRRAAFLDLMGDGAETRLAPPRLVDARRAQALAHYWVGMAYLLGAGVPPDATLAIAHQCAAVSLGSPAAARALARMLTQGRGLPRDLALARSWLALPTPRALAPCGTS